MHVSYGSLVQKLLRKFNPATGRGAASRVIKGLAHITGGGFVDNLPRVLPANCDVLIQKGSWDVLPIFQILQERGGIPEAELYQVFNMGIGMAVFLPASQAELVLKYIRTQKMSAWVIGEVVAGTGLSRVV